MLNRLLRWTTTTADTHVDPYQLLYLTWQLILLSTIQQSVEYMSDLVVFNKTQINLHTLVFAVVYGILFGWSFFSSTKSKTAPFVIAIVIALLDYPTKMIYGANHYHLNTLVLCVSSLALLLIRSLNSNEEANQQTQTEQQRQLSWDCIYLLRWFVVYLMLWTGLNKLIYGTYFQGEYLAYVLARELGETSKRSTFLEFYSFLLPAQEMEELKNVTNGPYRFQSMLAVIGSNAVYLLEIAAGLLLLIPKGRMIGAWLTFAVLMGIEIAAREWVFGSLLCQLILLYFPQFFVKYGFKLMLGFYAVVTIYLLLFGAGLIPDLGIT